MSDPLSKTFDVLASAGNVHAVEVLLEALDLPNVPARDLAVAALLKRSSPRGHMEIIRRLESLSPTARATVEEQVYYIEPALKQSLLNGDAQLRRNALEIVRAAEEYNLVPVLVEMLHDERNEQHELTAQTLGELVDRLYEHLRYAADAKANRRFVRNAPQVQHNVLAAFDHACCEFATLAHPEAVVEGVLALGDPDHFAVKKVLSQAAPPCRELAARLLVTSRHPGVMQLVLDFLSKNYPHPRAFDALQTRDDPEFIAHLLRWFPKRLSVIQQKNLRQIESVAWLDGDFQPLETMPASLQPPLVEFLAATGLAAERKLRVQEWLVRHGSPMGRLAAAEVLATLDADAVHEIIFEGLASDDPEVQAWATAQLRARRIPEALTLLMDRLDSPLESVRDTARGELEGFDVERMLGLFDQLDPVVCRRAAELLRKIDPECLEKFTRELGSPIRRRRMRAARGVQALGFQVELTDSLLAMLHDSDPLVRRTGVDVLGDAPTTESIAAIRRLLDDPSPRVRETAEKALARVRHGPAATELSCPAS